MTHVSVRALRALALLAAPLTLLPGALVAQTTPQPSTSLPPLDVTAAPKAPAKKQNAAPAAKQATPAPAAQQEVPQAVKESLSTPPTVARYALPVTSFSATAKQLDETINLKDPEDAVKYMPSLFVRKRNDGDNQAVLATRSWGLNSSARTMIYQDDLLLSTYIGNNNSGASPKWNLVSPESIARVDFLSGPFSAAYPGNSIGGVLLITSKMPEKFEATAKETISIMPWSQYGTKDTYVSSQTSASAGSKVGGVSWFISSTFHDSYQQPLTYVTNGSAPANTTGTIFASNKQGVAANVLGAGTLAHSQQTATNLKVVVDVAPAIKASYSVGLWTNSQNSNPDSYLRNTTTGGTTFGGISGFASGKYQWEQTHLSNAVSLKSDTKGNFDFDFSASTYNYLQDIQLNPYTVGANTVATGATFSQNGRITRNDGTNWQNADARFIWRPTGITGAHEVSFGTHYDRYKFDNPTFASSIWNFTSSSGTGQLYSWGRGETQTAALWAQDAWKFAPGWKLTLGGRLENWKANNGFNLQTSANSAGVIGNSTRTFVQPELSSTNFSPKLSLSYDVSKHWNVTASFGQAYRYPTVTELYQTATVAGVIATPNPNLAPEEDLIGEINIEHKVKDGRTRLTLFREHANNAIISQTSLVTNANGAQAPVSVASNVDAIRMQGVEVSAEKDNVFFRGFQVFASATYVDSEILSDPNWAGTDPLTGKATTVVGKRVPYVPDWRAKLGFTYRPTDTVAWTVAGRYSGRQFSTLDNTDRIGHVYGAFDPFVVIDTKVHWDASKNTSFDFGVDNVFDHQYTLFHPFPGRTFVMAGKVKF